MKAATASVSTTVETSPFDFRVKLSPRSPERGMLPPKFNESIVVFVDEFPMSNSDPLLIVRLVSNSLTSGGLQKQKLHQH